MRTDVRWGRGADRRQAESKHSRGWPGHLFGTQWPLPTGRERSKKEVWVLSNASISQLTATDSDPGGLQSHLRARATLGKVEVSLLLGHRGLGKGAGRSSMVGTRLTATSIASLADTGLQICLSGWGLQSGGKVNFLWAVPGEGGAVRKEIKATSLKPKLCLLIHSTDIY